NFVTHQQSDGGSRKLLQHGDGKRETVAAHANARLDFLLEGFKIFLELAREEFSHLGVHALYIGDERQQTYQRDDHDRYTHVHRAHLAVIRQEDVDLAFEARLTAGHGHKTLQRLGRDLREFRFHDHHNAAKRREGVNALPFHCNWSSSRLLDPAALRPHPAAPE